MVLELCFCQITTDFDEWSLNSDEWSSKSEANWSNCNWCQRMVIKIRNKLVKTITSKHYFTLIPIFYQIATNFDEWSSKKETNGLKQSPPNTISHSFLYSVKLKRFHQNAVTIQTLYHNLQKTSSQTEPRVWERVRDKKGRASLKNSMNGFSDAMV